MATDGQRVQEGLGLEPEDHPLLPLLPMLYLVWADGELTAAEAEGITSRLDASGTLDEGSRQRLRRWLDPAHPPSASSLRAILHTIRRLRDRLPEASAVSLTHLGMELAREVAPGGIAFRTETLEEIEQALGVATPEACRRLLLGDLPRPEQEEGREPPAFDPAALRALLDAPYAEVRDHVRARISSPGFAYLSEPDRAAYREKVLEWCRQLGRDGFGALGYPESCGGAGDLGKFIAAFETLAFHDPSLVVKFGVQYGLFGGSVLQLGTERHHQAILPPTGTLELPGCFAMSETRHGSNVADLQTVARFDPASGDFILHTPDPMARKDWIGNAARHGKMAVVFAQLETGGEVHGVHAFLVTIRGEDGAPAPGVTIEDCGAKEGLNGVDNGRITFDHVRVPREDLLNRFADVSPEGVYSSPIASPSRRFFTMLGTLVAGRISVAAAALSAAKSGLAIAIRYSERRRQFGPTGKPETKLLDYPPHQRRLLPRLAACYALDFAHKDLVRRFLARTEEDTRQVEVLAAGIKSWASWHTVAALQDCRECCGGQGYLAVNRIPGLKADTDVYTTFEGDNTVLMQLVAKGCLTQYRDQFNEMSPFGLLRFLSARTAFVLTDLNPILARNGSESHLRDPEFQLEAFRHREEHLLTTAASRIKARLDRGMDPFEAFRECQGHLLRLANAHVERVILEPFTVAVEASSGGEREVLTLLRDLFALWRIEEDRGWFLETGHMEGMKTKAIRALVDRLCIETRRHALSLVEAWGIPDECLAAPIAFGPAAGL
ncbi:MAG TPA: acyl-CoA dehydrogenase [Thermoanaerobaculia bacterium]|nr:acyl-CoA dehydrogenase [Thermoanaerobaculia bacterium]